MNEPTETKLYEFFITICIYAETDKEAELRLRDYVMQENIVNDITNVVITKEDIS